MAQAVAPGEGHSCVPPTVSWSAGSHRRLPRIQLGGLTTLLLPLFAKGAGWAGAWIKAESSCPRTGSQWLTLITSQPSRWLGPRRPPSVLLELASQHQSRHGGLGLAWDSQTGALLPVDTAPPLTSQVCSFVYSKSIY